MHKKYKKVNGWYKFWSASGMNCRIKTESFSDQNVIIKFRDPKTEEWLWYPVNKTFKNESELIHYICSNLETSGMLFRVYTRLVNKIV